uniref:ADAM metallopeptidase domain 29 n=1 Tax=Moschus moschiferus TaxID=68415 RepID=A0A8C6CGW0_MOSMO
SRKTWAYTTLFQKQNWLQVLNSSTLKCNQVPPEVVIPLKITGTGRGMKPPGRLSYSLHLGGQRHVFHMKVKKHLLSRHLPVFTYSEEGALLKDQPFVQNDCYYHGYVEGDPESLVALSTCLGGFRGLLQINNVVYEIKPMIFSTKFEHLVYKMESEETQFPTMKSGFVQEETVEHFEFQETGNFTLKQSHHEGWWIHSFFVEMAVVVDYTLYNYFKKNVSKVKEDLFAIVNIVDSIYQVMGMKVLLIGLEFWTQRNFVEIDAVQRALRDFCVWKRKSFNTRLPHDIAHLFIKENYGRLLGLAYVGTVCNQLYNCGVDSFLNDKLQEFAYIVSHEIGHNLGMRHDDKICKCGSTKCIMFPSKTVATRFSNCSYASYWNVVGKVRCMRISPNPENVFRQTRCGNSVVEEGEQCDCGSTYTCAKDPCCQSDCTLRAGATCAFGLCCENCTFMPSGSTCRKVENECDLPEWCNGTSYQCPEDVYMQDGTSCSGGGYCYEKRCNDRNEQCRKIFGKEAKNANEDCYKEVNTRGDRFGNCGLTASSYIQCEIPDILCGRVQCENVTEVPFLRDHSTVHWTRINGVNCWGTDYHLGMPIPDIGEVKDGTECGANHICINRKCTLKPSFGSVCSAETCNMNGVCNNRQHCHCSSEWRPPRCQAQGAGGSVDSGPPPGGDAAPDYSYLLLFRLIPLLFMLKVLQLNLSEKDNVLTQYLRKKYPMF